MPFGRQRARVERMGVVDRFMSPPGLDFCSSARSAFRLIILGVRGSELWRQSGGPRRRNPQAIRMKSHRLYYSVLALGRQFLTVEKEIDSAHISSLHNHFILRDDQLLRGSDESRLVGRIAINSNGEPAFVGFFAHSQQDGKRNRSSRWYRRDG